ncbi:hypothetical protein [Acinetobacter calcoaceticus]|uniref:hypothetical protein n=1 Tax=Acinetobacter calcoaceticus TaxID=471 RepID=UPI002273B59D|nr:hypothetical protein [Acinetobacter calcoaceticus]GLG84160.1 hypothetical protein ACSO1_26840 [Acinetobacter calcoaceticus]
MSDLLTNRNGVAIIATHSPVLLQGVPKACVSIIRRIRLTSKVDRPESETFAENVGVLTREVFGLEVTKSGYHELLEQSVSNGKTYEEIESEYDNQLGFEGDAIRYLGIYRANLLQRVLFAKEIMTDVPVHTLMALRDPFLPPYLFDDSKNWASNSSESTVNAAHWAPLSQPKVLADNIRKFLLSINNK